MVLSGWFNLHSSNIALCPFEIKDNNGSVPYMFRTKCYFNMSCIERALNELIKRNNSIQKKERKNSPFKDVLCVTYYDNKIVIYIKNHSCKFKGQNLNIETFMLCQHI